MFTSKRASSRSNSPTSPSEPRSSTSTSVLGVVKVRCVWHANVSITDTPSGAQYHFKRGEVLEVDPVDVTHLLSKQHVGGGCCGSSAKPQPKFQVEA